MDIELGRAFTAPEDRAGVPVIVLGAETAASCSVRSTRSAAP
jgi:hypothetical protein